MLSQCRVDCDTWGLRVDSNIKTSSHSLCAAPSMEGDTEETGNSPGKSEDGECQTGSETESEGGTHIGELWVEVKEWRRHWKLSRFFYALTLGLATSLFDFGADFNFAWSVPEDCRNTTATGMQTFHKAFVSSPCGLLYYKNVERLTYTYIAFPGFLLGFSSIRSLVRGLLCSCWRGEGLGIVRGLMSAFVVTLEVSFVAGLLFAAQWSDVWEKANPDLAPVYDYTIQGMAYLSSALIVGVKCLGVFCHGPETRRLVFRATKDETIFEAATQLGLLVRIFMSSGIGSSASRLSAVSSIVVIGKVGVQNFLNRHSEKLSRTTVLGKICVAVSVLPVFLLTAVFKIGAGASNHVWNEKTKMVAILIALGLPNLIILFFKMCNLRRKLTTANMSQGIIADFLSLHLWPQDRHGKKIGLAMTVFSFLVYASPLPLAISNPQPKTQWTAEYHNAEYNEYESETGNRVWTASICFLVIGSLAFVWVICMILFEDEWVAKIVAKFPNHSKAEANGANKEPPAIEVEIDPRNSKDIGNIQSDLETVKTF